MRIENNTTYSNTNFCAKLKIDKWNNPLITQERWKNIADIFEMQTKNNPQDIVNIYANGGHHIEFNICNEGMNYIGTDYNQLSSKNFFGDLDKQTDNEVANILTRLFKFHKNISDMFLDYMKFADQMREKYGVFKFGTDPYGYGYCRTNAHSSTDELVSSLIAAKHEYVRSNGGDWLNGLGGSFDLSYNGTKIV